MKQLLILLCAGLAMGLSARTQPIVKQSQPGFDSVRAGIPHGKIDTMTYASRSVGTTRRFLVYTPPGYSKKTNTPFCTCCTALAAMKKNGSVAGTLR